MRNVEIEKQNRADRVDRVLNHVANGLFLFLVLAPELAMAQSGAASASGMMGGVTSFLRGFVNLIIFEWGYYIGIATLAIQGYRWKTGHANLMDLGKWGLGVSLIFFAPNIVDQLRANSSGAL